MFRYLVFALLAFTVHSIRGTGKYSGCCEEAIQQRASTSRQLDVVGNYVCGQKYESSPNIPAPAVWVSLKWCYSTCPDFTPARFDDKTNWATTLMQYILPVILFTINIPRRLKLEELGSAFEPHLNKLKRKRSDRSFPKSIRGVLRWLLWWLRHLVLKILSWFWFILGPVLAAAVIVVDHVIWAGIVFAGAGPMIYSGLHEMLLDRRIFRLIRLREQQGDGNRQGLYSLEMRVRIELMLVMLAGNLGWGKKWCNNEGRCEESCNSDSCREKCWEDIKSALLTSNNDACAMQARLLAMLDSQSSFGYAVGAAILFYLGNFLYATLDLYAKRGDGEAARSLSLGIWWMVIIIVATIGGCHLANSSPTTISALTSTKGSASKRAYILIPFYGVGFEPVTLWSRGSSKAALFCHSMASHENEIISRTTTTRNYDEWGLFLAAIVLLGTPTVLAIVVTLTTNGDACRFLCIASWLVLQVLQIMLCMNRDRKAPGSWADLKFDLETKRILRLGCLVCLLLLASIASFLMTVLQLAGVFRSCFCSMSFREMVHYGNDEEERFVQLATDTADDRGAHALWHGLAVAAIVYTTLVCYIGWFYNVRLRREFVKQVESLADPQHVGSNEEMMPVM